MFQVGLPKGTVSRDQAVGPSLPEILAVPEQSGNLLMKREFFSCKLDSYIDIGLCSVVGHGLSFDVSSIRSSILQRKLTVVKGFSCFVMINFRTAWYSHSPITSPLRLLIRLSPKIVKLIITQWCFVFKYVSNDTEFGVTFSLTCF